MPRLKRSAIVVEDPALGHLLFTAFDMLDLTPRAHDVSDDDLPTLRALANDDGASADVDPAVVDRWRRAVPGLVVDNSVEDELAATRAFAKDRRFTLEFISATEAMTPSTLDTEAYHQDVIADADAQFDDVETTLAHAFAYAAKALQGRTYGSAFADAVVARLDAARLAELRAGASRLRIAELGCGTGRFAHNFLDRLLSAHPALFDVVDYTLVDLSPALQASQEQRVAGFNLKAPRPETRARVRFVLGDLLKWTPEAPHDVVISNEVIADLPVRPLYVDQLAQPGEAADVVRRYGLSLEGAPHAVLVNTGAIQLVERLTSLLRPGGLAIVTEYGSTTRPPIRVVLGDHVEHSIQFGHLQVAARQLGLTADVVRVIDVVGLDEDAAVADLDGLDVVRRAVGPLLGLPPLPRMCFSRAEVDAWLGSNTGRVHGLRFVPVGQHPLRPDLFLALVARKN